MSVARVAYFKKGTIRCCPYNIAWPGDPGKPAAAV
jgi:hypothetical protein